MKRVGIITIHKINNYGAIEQAYALNKFLRNLDYDVKTIDFQTYRVAESYRIFYPIKSRMDIIRNGQALLYYFKLKRRNRRFSQFLDSMIPMTKRTYFSNEELQNEQFDFEYYICGSDQIWNTYCKNYNSAFILAFARNKGIRISYAASMGAADICEEQRKEFQEELSDYRGISVRENSAVKVISELAGKEVTHVVDPVFLLQENEWRQIASKRLIKEPYIFFYFVHGDLPGMRDYVKNLSATTGLPIAVANMNLREMQYKNKKFYDAGPREFLSLIENAEYVCTNSFHASAFSILFKKKFMVFTDTSKGKGVTSSRIYSILSTFGLESRVASIDSAVTDMKKEIDYEIVSYKLEKEINKSKQFLMEMLNYKVIEDGVM